MKYFLIISLWVVTALLTQSPVSAQATSHPASLPDSDKAGSVQSAAERAIDWLDKQIAPPSTVGESSGLALFDDPEKKRSAIKTGATLTLVLSLFLIVIFLLRMMSSGKHGKKGVPREVLSVIGKIPFVENQQLQLVRLGTRLLLVSTSATGSQTLGEISDPDEVFQIELACQSGQLGRLSESLRHRATQPESPRSAGVSLGSSQRSGRTLLEA